MNIFDEYSNDLQQLLQNTNWDTVENLARTVQNCWNSDNQLFLCGNGGSAGNAIHLANDFVYGCGAGIASKGMRVQALSANPATITCIANDVSYASIYSIQLEAFAQTDDVLIVFSGSGNSDNIIEALSSAKRMGLKTAAVLGYDGGKAKNIADIVVHFPIPHMQIAEDMQLVVGHMIMRWLRKNPPHSKAIPET